MPAPVVLVADRDPLQRQLIDLLLAEDRYLIVAVESGKQALEYVRENTPDLAILDLDLGDVSGADVCEKMKSVTRLHKVPVILTTTAKGGVGLDARTKSLIHFVAADMMLLKPLGDKNLRRRVGELLAGESTSPKIVGEGLRSTAVIEAAIRSIETAPPAESEPQRTDEELPAIGQVAELQVRIEELESQLAKASSNGSLGRGSRLPLKVQAELDRLHERVEEQERTIEELKRRNDLLVEAIEEEKRRSAQRGIFGRRRSF